jgi:hypothetical protein
MRPPACAECAGAAGAARTLLGQRESEADDVHRGTSRRAHTRHGSTTIGSAWFSWPIMSPPRGAVRAPQASAARHPVRQRRQ